MVAPAHWRTGRAFSVSLSRFAAPQRPFARVRQAVAVYVSGMVEDQGLSFLRSTRPHSAAAAIALVG